MFTSCVSLENTQHTDVYVVYTLSNKDSQLASIGQTVGVLYCTYKIRVLGITNTFTHYTAVEISRMTDLIRMQFLALHARMMKDKHQRMKERGFYKVSVAKRTVIRQCKA